MQGIDISAQGLEKLQKALYNHIKAKIPRNEDKTNMNIQIFGSEKSFDSKKAERFFSDRKIKYQFVKLKEKPMSRGEFDSVKRAVGGYENLIDENCKDKKTLTLIKYLTDDAKEEKLFENQQLIKTPIVRNGKLATVGYTPEIWKTWE